MEYDYNVSIVRNRNTPIYNFKMKFEVDKFHHLCGLHKLVDIEDVRTAPRMQIFNRILNDEKFVKELENSQYINTISDRIECLENLENTLDSDFSIFRFNKLMKGTSSIKCDYILKYEDADNRKNFYLMIENSQEKDVYDGCSSFIREPNEQDFSLGHTSYKILKKEKHHIDTDKSQTIYVAPSYAAELAKNQSVEKENEVTPPVSSKPKVTNIMQADSTMQVPFELSAGGVASISPNAPLPSFNDFIKAVKDMANTFNLAVVKFEHKVSETINKFLNPPKSKPKSVSKARTTKSDKSTTPKKKAVKTPQSVSERKPVKQVAQDKPKAQEKKPSVIGGIKEIKAEQAKEPKTPSKERSANKNKSNSIDI